MTLLDKILCTMFALGMILSFPSLLIGPLTSLTCLGIGVIGAIGMILSLIWRL